MVLTLLLPPDVPELEQTHLSLDILCGWHEQQDVDPDPIYQYGKKFLRRCDGGKLLALTVYRCWFQKED